MFENYFIKGQEGCYIQTRGKKKLGIQLFDSLILVKLPVTARTGRIRFRWEKNISLLGSSHIFSYIAC